MAHPIFRSIARSRVGSTPAALFVLAWGLLGIALWGALGVSEWLTVRRPAVVIEAFLVETATTARIEELGQMAQDQPYFCELVYVDAEEARAEASMVERIRPLLDAYGGNPFLRSLRFTMCADRIGDLAAAAEWLDEQEAVMSVRTPVESVETMLDAESRLRRTVYGAVILLAALAAVLAALAVRLRLVALAPELEMLERLGAAASLIWGRVIWGVTYLSVAVACLVVLVLEVGSLAARFSGGWVSWPGARLPDFPHVAGAGVAVAALLIGLVLALAACATRSYAIRTE